MSTAFAVGDVIQTRLNFGQAGNVVDVAYNVLHYRVTAFSGTQPGMTAGLGRIAQDMFDKWSALWKPAASVNVRMTGVTCQNVFPLPRSVGVTHTPGAPVPGDDASDALPLQDAPTLLKRSDFGQRWGIGRLFYVGLAEAFNEEGLVVNLGIGHLQTMANALKDGLGIVAAGWSITLQPVLVRGSTDNPVSLTPIVAGVLPDLVIKSQKRRRPGKGI